jgi:hypothetical protein
MALTARRLRSGWGWLEKLHQTGSQPIDPTSTLACALHRIRASPGRGLALAKDERERSL